MSPKTQVNRRRERDGASTDTALLARALPRFGIFDRESFDSVTGPPREVAGLYAYAQLDCLIELADQVAKDFFARPSLYTELDDPKLPEALARLASRVGSDEFLPSREQREAMYTPIFGAGEADGGEFVHLRNALLGAAAVLAEWSQATGIPAQRNAVRSAHVGFRAYLTGRIGTSVSWSRGRALPALADELAYPILRSKSIIAVFGLTKPAADQWPYREDGDGDKAVEEISKRLRDQGAPHITLDRFVACQRVALRGAEALAAIIDYQESDDDALDDAAVDALGNRCYTWYTALRARDARGGAGMTAAGDGAPRNGDLVPLPISAGHYLARHGS